MRKLFIILIFIAAGLNGYGQGYDFNIVYLYPINPTYQVSSSSYQLTGDFGTITQLTGAFSIDAMPLSVKIDFEITKTDGTSVCVETWEVLLPSTTCYSVQNFGNSDCTPGSQTYDVYYSLTPKNLSFESNTTVSNNIINDDPYCTSKKIWLVAIPGYSSYQWQYSYESTQWHSFNPGLGNDVSFTIDGILGSAADTLLGQHIFFRYNVGNCTDYSNVTGIEYVFSIAAPVITSVATTPVSCYGANDGAFEGIELSPNEHNIGVSYDIYESGNPIDAIDPIDYNSLIAGDYEIILQTQNAYCNTIGSGTFKISQPTQILISFSNQQNVICYGDTNGSVTVAASGGSGAGYQYSKDGINYNSSTTVTGLSAGSNTIYVMDGAKCEVTKEVIISGPDYALEATISINSEPTCASSADGSININASGGWPGYTFSATEKGTFAPTGTFANLPGGLHTFWIKDSGGCKISSTVELTAPPEIIIDSIVISPPPCIGEDASLTINASGGTGALVFSLDNSTYHSFSQFDVLAGSYKAYIQDKNGCVKVSQDIIIQDPQPVTYETVITPVTCNNGSDGIIQIKNPTNGTAPYEFSIDGGASYSTLSTYYNIQPGTFNIAIKDNNGCVSKSIIVIDNPAPITGVINETAIICNGFSNGALEVTGNGGTGALSYLWFNGETTNRVTDLAAGTYSVKIFDQNNCESNLIEYVLNEPDEIIISSLSVDNNGYDLACFGDNDAIVDLLVSGGTAAVDYVYLWSNGQTGSTLSNVIAGQYSVEVTDDNGCIANAFIDVSTPPELAFSEILVTEVACNGGSSGNLQLAAMGGVGGNQYALENGSFGVDSSFVDLSAGNYLVSVMDMNNCITSENVIIAEPNLIEIILLNSQNTLCGQANGAVDVDITGGIAPYSYQWTDNLGNPVATTQDIGNVYGGTYTLEITDANNCLKQASFSVSDSDGPKITVDSVVGTTCFDSTDGAASISITGGVLPYTIDWQNGLSTFEAVSLPAGLINVQVTDAAGCVSFKQIDIPGKAIIELSEIVLMAPLCFGEANGSISIAASGGEGPYTFTWENGDTGSAIDNISSGSYEVTVTDSFGCSITEVLELNQPVELSLTLEVSNPSCVDANDGSVLIDILGGTPPFSYVFAGLPASSYVQNLAPDNYSIEIIDANGCSLVASVEIANPEPMVIAFDDMVICEGQTVELFSPVEAISYQWSIDTEIISISDKVIVDREGKYSLEIINIDGCSAEGSFNVTTSNDVLNGDFLMSSTAYVGDTVIIIDITYPLPDSSRWVIPANTDVIEQTNDFAMLVFSNPGIYEIGFEAYLGQCYDYYVSMIEILAAPEGAVDGRPGDENEPLILSLAVYPNPNDGVFKVTGDLSQEKTARIKLINLFTNQIVREKGSASAFTHNFEFDLPELSPGNYAIVLEADNQVKVFRMIKR